MKLLKKISKCTYLFIMHACLFALFTSPCILIIYKRCEVGPSKLQRIFVCISDHDNI